MINLLDVRQRLTPGVLQLIERQPTRSHTADDALRVERHLADDSGAINESVGPPRRPDPWVGRAAPAVERASFIRRRLIIVRRQADVLRELGQKQPTSD